MPDASFICNHVTRCRLPPFQTPRLLLISLCYLHFSHSPLSALHQDPLRLFLLCICSQDPPRRIASPVSSFRRCFSIPRRFTIDVKEGRQSRWIGILLDWRKGASVVVSRVAKIASKHYTSSDFSLHLVLIVHAGWLGSQTRTKKNKHCVIVT